MSFISNLENHQVDALREHLLSDFRAFSLFAFKVQTGAEFLEVDYHDVMFKAIQQLIDQKVNRMIINIPPRAGKTQIISIFLPLFAWCRNPHGQNILTGFNQDVLHECSGYIRSIMSDPDFIKVFPDVAIDMNKKSVERLGTMSGGVTHAIPSSGKLTGKGAGTLAKDFSGIFCIDDIIKPDDANSPTEREKINNRYSNTILSRLATETTPLVVIMQRLHSDDLAGFMLKGKSPDTSIHWLNIPGLITRETGSKEWYDKQIDTYGYADHITPIYYDLERPDDMFDENGESSFWAVRKSLATLQALRDVDPYTFYSQYQGEPVSKGSAAVNEEDIRSYDELDPSTIKYTFMTADTASTVQTYSDPTAAIFWGVNKNNELVLIDSLIGKFEVPELIVEIRKFWKKHNKFDLTQPTMTPRGFYLENKSSGQFLNQQYTKDGSVTVREVPRDSTSGDKFSRFMNAIPYFKQNRIIFPKGHDDYDYIKREVLGMNEYGNNTGHDDVCDNISDAVAVAFTAVSMDYSSWQ